MKLFNPTVKDYVSSEEDLSFIFEGVTSIRVSGDYLDYVIESPDKQLKDALYEAAKRSVKELQQEEVDEELALLASLANKHQYKLVKGTKE